MDRRTHWVASLKDNFGPNHGGMQRRARSYWSTTDILRNESVQWVHRATHSPAPRPSEQPFFASDG